MEVLAKGNNLLVTGRPGIGKSAFLRALRDRMREGRPCVWAPEGNVKTAIFDMARQVHGRVGLRVPEERIPPKYRAKARRLGYVEWHYIARNLSRMPAKDCMALIVDSVKGKGVLVFVETLEVPPAQAEFYTALLDVAQVAAAMCDTNRRVRIQRVLWCFRDRIELKPLAAPQCREIAERWLEGRPVRFASERVREAFLRAVEQDSGGVPFAVRGMLEAAAAEPEVTRSMVRGFAHEAGVRYVDMTFTFVIAFVIAIAGRYIARGIGSDELYILSGVGFALFLGLRFLLWRLK